MKTGLTYNDKDLMNIQKLSKYIIHSLNLKVIFFKKYSNKIIRPETVIGKMKILSS